MLPDRFKAQCCSCPDFYGPSVDKSFLHIIFTAAAKGDRATVIGPLDALHEYVFVPSVGPVVARLIEKPEAWGRVRHLAGAGTITAREVVHQAFALTGRKPRTFVEGKTMLCLAGLFNPLMREMVEMNYLQTSPLGMDDSALRALLDDLPKTSYQQGISQEVAAAQAASGHIS